MLGLIVLRLTGKCFDESVSAIVTMEMYDERKRSQICNLSGFFYTTAQIGFYFRGSHSTTFLWLMINGIFCMGFFYGNETAC